jgi:hypothetical protein
MGLAEILLFVAEVIRSARRVIAIMLIVATPVMLTVALPRILALLPHAAGEEDDDDDASASAPVISAGGQLPPNAIVASDNPLIASSARAWQTFKEQTDGDPSSSQEGAAPAAATDSSAPDNAAATPVSKQVTPRKPLLSIVSRLQRRSNLKSLMLLTAVLSSCLTLLFAWIWRRRDKQRRDAVAERLFREANRPAISD